MNVRRTSPAALLAVVLAASIATALPSRAHAESSEWNLHLEPAFAMPLEGMLAPGDDGPRAFGFFLWGELDWQLARPFALELIIGGGHAEHFAGQPDVFDGTFVHGGIGGRLRFADDESGYSDEARGNFFGNGWVSLHVGAMAWHGPQLAIDLAVGYQLSLPRPVQAGFFARGVLGLFGDGESTRGGGPDFILTLGVSISLELSVGVIPNGRYGVADVQIEGLDDLDEAALRACLGTQERSQLGFDFGASSALTCGDPPFDSDRWRLDLFSWPWTEWPLFDASVFERDVLRVERWLRARGYYEGHVVESRVMPTEALGEAVAEEDASQAACLADPTRGCEVRVSFTVEEGEPVLVERISIRGEQEIDPGLRARLREALLLRHGNRFDEALFEETKRSMVRTLAENAYPDARVDGEVKINTERHEAFLLFQIETGPRAVLGRICVTGYGELPPATIMNATFLSPGTPFSISAIEEAQRAIFALGTLSSVEIRHRTLEDAEGRAPGAEPGEGVDPETVAEVEAAADAAPDADADPDPEPNPDAAPDPEAEAEADAEAEVESEAMAEEAAEVAAERGADAPPQPPYCLEGPTSVAEGTRAVDLDVRVAPGRLERIGLGVGLQAGDTLGFGTPTAGGATINQQALQQWDIHLLVVAEWRNLLGDMLRLRIEERPRLIFPAQFPGVDSSSGLGPSLGNRISLGVRWPAFLEPRTALFASIQHDYGPIPLYGFFRHELDGRVGLERTFFDGRLYISSAVRGNLFIPVQYQGLRLDSQYQTTRVLFLEQNATLDLRDDPRNPQEGAFFALGLQEAGVVPVSTWNYFRITAEARGYVPLGLGLVLAMRFGVGAMFIGDTSDELRESSIYDLDELGPLSQQLQGGGSISNRGFPPGLMGEVYRREVERRPLPGGGQGPNQAIIVSGGRFRWEGSVELRIPVTPEIGLVLFADVGNVSRSEMRFDILNFAFGWGLRYRTIIGPLRFDMAFRLPDELQYIGGTDPRVPACSDQVQFECRPDPTVNLGVVEFPGAIHLTIGEAF
ncbi:MAG: BamA/TamA family outer membrane protein [Myxococcota bacterium]|nr:BamA/TamA family outer membrane protein [Myxococcota bacterium]